MGNKLRRNPLKRRQSSRYTSWKRQKDFSEGNSKIHRMYVNPAVNSEEEAIYGNRNFSDLDLDARLMARLKEKGFERPTLIQDQSYEAILEGRDVLGIARTGTGKTVAFLLPLLQRQLQDADSRINTLIVTPTRELALQIDQELQTLTKDLKVHSACLIGGTSVKRNIQELKSRKHFVIGTPGRLLDMIGRRALQLKYFSVLILDEFDKMLDMGFADSTLEIAGGMKNRSQTLCFSATIEGQAGRMLHRFTNDPLEIRVTDGHTTSDRVDEDIVEVPAGKKKYEVLVNLLKQPEFEKVLVFAETKLNVQYLAEKLKRSGIAADAIHGDKNQRERKSALDRFKNGKVRVLVATDIASRGIDVQDISHVINYERPENHESYLHRIGRTGRAGKSGKALTFVE